MDPDPPSRRPTIGDVATAAQVSRTTVSRVLNGNATVDPQLAHRVHRAAAELGYRPNLTALGLARGSTGVLGMIVPDIANPFFSGALKGFEAVAGAEDRRVILAESNEDEDLEFRLTEELSRRCDGVVLCSVRMDSARLHELATSGNPLVLVNRVEPTLKIPFAAVEVDNAIESAMSSMSELGHRHLGYLAGPKHAWTNNKRLQAFTAVARRMGLQTSVARAGTRIEEAYEATFQLLTAGVTGILAFNDLVAFGALARIRELGLDSPRDISLVGFDDIPSGRFAAPPLSTIRTRSAELGEAAWQVLRERMHGQDCQDRWLECEYVSRGSVAKPSGRVRIGRWPAACS